MTGPGSASCLQHGWGRENPTQTAPGEALTTRHRTGVQFPPSPHLQDATRRNERPGHSVRVFRCLTGGVMTAARPPGHRAGGGTTTPGTRRSVHRQSGGSGSRAAVLKWFPLYPGAPAAATGTVMSYARAAARIHSGKVRRRPAGLICGDAVMRAAGMVSPHRAPSSPSAAAGMERKPGGGGTTGAS